MTDSRPHRAIAEGLEANFVKRTRMEPMVAQPGSREQGGNEKFLRASVKKCEAPSLFEGVEAL